MRRPLLLFLMCMISVGASAQKAIQGGLNLRSIDYFWREAVEMYTMESDDYAETLKVTLEELKYWRLRVLQDKFEVKISDLEIVLSKSNAEELKQMEAFVTKRGMDSLDDTLMMRLAQLHYDRANFDLAVKMKKMKNSGDFSHSMPTPNYSSTIRYTSEIIKRYPSSSILDHAYYLLGYCLFDEGKEKEGAVIYERMLNLFPHSSLSMEARWRMAEQYFERGDFEKAVKAYQGLIEIKNPFYAKALYKYGASEYSAGSFEKAFKIFLRLYKESSENLGSQDPEVETLYNEAIDYIAHLKAKEFPMNLDEETDSLATRRLAEVYRHAQDENSARRMEMQFVAAHTLSKWAPGFLNRVIESYEYENNFNGAQKVRAQFLAAYGPSAPFWTQHAVDVPTVVEVQDLYESILLSSADYHASQAKQNKRPEDYKMAIDYYLKFIEEYPSSPLRNQAKYEMADLQYFSKRYADATATYMDMTADTENDEFREEAAYGYFLAETKRINFDVSTPKNLAPQREKNGILKPVSEVTKEEGAFIDAADFYLKNVRKGARRQKVLYKKAEIYFKHNNFEKVRENLELIFKDTELSAVAPKALILLSATYNVENNWTKVVQTSKRAAEMSRRQNFESIDSEMLFKAKSPTLLTAWKAEKRGDLEEAVDQYEHYSIMYSRAAEAPFALLRAGQLYREMGRIKDSDRVLKRLNDDYPDNDYQSRVDFFLAANQESKLNFEAAAKAFETVARRNSRNEIGLQAMLSAGYLRKALGQNVEAAQNFVRYANAVKDDTTFFRAASLYQEAKMQDQANQIYDRYIKQKGDASLAVQALFEKAYATKSENVADASCNQAAQLSKRAKNGLTASAVHNLYGCTYVKSRFLKDKILKSKGKSAEKRWAKLTKVYGEILESNDDLWMMEVLHDLQKLRKTGRDEDIDKIFADYKAKLADRYVEDLDIKLLPDQKPQPEVIVVRWPIESSLARVAYDQKKWVELEKQSNLELGIKSQGYLFMSLARAQAEQSNWTGAQATLNKCVSAVREQACVAALSILDANVRTPTWKLPTDDEAYLKLATMIEKARMNKGKEVSKEAQDIVALDPQMPDTYRYLSHYYYKQGNDDLAMMTLEQGLRNTQNEERLMIQKGYLALKTGDLEAAQMVADDLKFTSKSSAESVIFRSHFAYFKGEKESAKNILKVIKGAEPQNKNIDEAIQTQAAWTAATGERLPAQAPAPTGEEFQ